MKGKVSVLKFKRFVRALKGAKKSSSINSKVINKDQTKIKELEKRVLRIKDMINELTRDNVKAEDYREEIIALTKQISVVRDEMGKIKDSK